MFMLRSARIAANQRCCGSVTEGVVCYWGERLASVPPGQAARAIGQEQEVEILDQGPGVMGRDVGNVLIVFLGSAGEGSLGGVRVIQHDG